MHHHNWCQKAVIALKNGEPIVPCRVFLSGPGKSHIIKLIHSNTKLLRLAGTLQPLLSNSSLWCSSINGITLHSALLLDCSKYSGFQSFMVPALINVQIIFSYLWLLYGNVHMEAIHHWD